MLNTSRLRAQLQYAALLICDTRNDDKDIGLFKNNSFN